MRSVQLRTLVGNLRWCRNGRMCRLAEAIPDERPDAAGRLGHKHEDGVDDPSPGDGARPKGQERDGGSASSVKGRQRRQAGLDRQALEQRRTQWMRRRAVKVCRTGPVADRGRRPPGRVESQGPCRRHGRRAKAEERGTARRDRRRTRRARASFLSASSPRRRATTLR